MTLRVDRQTWSREAAQPSDDPAQLSPIPSGQERQVGVGHRQWAECSLQLGDDGHSRFFVHRSPDGGAATQVAPGVPEIEATKRWLTASGYFGASTGAGAAIAAAADSAVNTDAVVSRGGRPDLAGESLKCIDSPTLLIVGGLDDVVLELNRQVQAEIPAECELVVVPGATHLFEELGTLGESAAAG